ncbi:TPA: hypothetical protein NV714_003269 [Escherichia coli]|nr:hypothetical protein [Escherichia coli]
MKIFKKSVLMTSLTIVLGVLSVQKNAIAIPVYDTGTHIGINLLTTAVTSGFSTQNALLAANHTQLMSYLMGTTTGGNGLVEGITSMNTKLGFLVSATKQDPANSDLAARARMMDEIQLKDKQSTFQDANSCSEASFSALKGGASATSRDMHQVVTVYDMDNIKSAKREITQLQEVLNNRGKKGYCTQSESTNGVGTCSGGPGPLENADVTSLSLFTAVAGKKEKRNQTFETQEQRQAAQDYKENLKGVAPPSLDEEKAKTEGGVKYAALQNIYASRISAVLDSLNSISSLREGPSDDSKNAGARIYLGDPGKAWKDQETTWKIVFPGTPFPKSPSEKDTLNYDVFSRYADVSPTGWQNTIGAKDEKDIAAEMARMTALQLRLNLLSIDQQEKTNLLLAALLAQSLNPVTSDTLSNQFNTLNTSGNTKK